MPSVIKTDKEILNDDLHVISEWNIDWTFLRLKDMRKLKRLMMEKWKGGAKNASDTPE